MHKITLVEADFADVVKIVSSQAAQMSATYHQYYVEKLANLVPQTNRA